MVGVNDSIQQVVPALLPLPVAFTLRPSGDAIDKA